MEGGAQTVSLVAWSGFFLAVIFGAVGNKVNFCTMGAVSDVVNMGDWGRMRMWLLAIAVAIAGSYALWHVGLVDLSKSIYTAPNFTWLSFGMAIMFVGGSTGLLWFGIPTVLDACFPIRWEVCRSDSEWRFQKKLGRFVVRRLCARGVTFRAYPTCSRGDHGYALYGQSDRRRWRLLGCVFTTTASSATRQAEADLAALRQYVSAVA